MTSSPAQQIHDYIRIDHDGPLLTVTLQRPDRHNAMVPSMWLALADLGRSLPAEVRVVIFRGEGPSFCSGLDRELMAAGGVPGERDLHAQAAGGSDQLVAEIASYQEGFSVWRQIPALTIAAVQGHAIGAGFQLALACDLRIVADDARLAMRETSLGLVPDLAGTHPLVRLVGYARALEVCVTGRPVAAHEAVAWGLASLHVPLAELDEAARDLADAILANPPAAVIELKRLLLSAEGSTPEQQRYLERTAQTRLLTALAQKTH